MVKVSCYVPFHFFHCSILSGYHLRASPPCWVHVGDTARVGATEPFAPLGRRSTSQQLTTRWQWYAQPLSPAVNLGITCRAHVYVACVLVMVSIQRHAAFILLRASNCASIIREQHLFEEKMVVAHKQLCSSSLHRD